MWTTILALVPLCPGAAVPRAPEAPTLVLQEATDEVSLDDRVAQAIERFELAREAFEDQRYDRYQAYLEARKEDPEAKYEPGPGPAPEHFEGIDRFASAGSALALAWTLTHYHPKLPREERRADYVRRAAALLPAPADAIAGVSRAVRGQIGKTRLLDVPTGLSLLRVMELGFADPAESASAAYLRAALLHSEAMTEDEAALARAELKRISTQYAGTRSGDAAGRRLFELENLAIGKVAPEIVGQDVDGNPMRLSDFRGKVTVLDFWGFW